MIFGGIYGGFKNFKLTQQQNRFNIYSMDVLTAEDNTDFYIQIQFDGISKLRYQNNIDIPRQALENRQFSNDSILDNPYQLILTGEISQLVRTQDDLNLDLAGSTASTLDYLLKNDILLAILRAPTLFEAYTNMKLKDYYYDQSESKNNLAVTMTFEEIRTAYIPSDANTYTGFDPASTSNPINASVVDSGIVTPSSPAGNINSLGVGGLGGV